MTIRPIRNADDHRAALARIEQLWSAEAGTPEGDELEVLGTLVDAYERKVFPIGPPTPAAAIQFRMEQQGMSRQKLEPLIGSRARVSEILTHKRSLTLPMIRRLHAELDIPLEALVAEERAVKRSTPKLATKAPKAATRGTKAAAKTPRGRGAAKTPRGRAARVG